MSLTNLIGSAEFIISGTVSSVFDVPVTYTYTGYPMVRQMREMIKNGSLGNIQKIDAQYYQGWINPIIHDVEKRKTTWRLNPEK